MVAAQDQQVGFQPFGLGEDFLHRRAAANPGLELVQLLLAQTLLQPGACRVLVG